MQAVTQTNCLSHAWCFNFTVGCSMSAPQTGLSGQPRTSTLESYLMLKDLPSGVTEEKVKEVVSKVVNGTEEVSESLLECCFFFFFFFFFFFC